MGHPGAARVRHQGLCARPQAHGEWEFSGEDYFERLLAEIREIRLSERKFYQKITDIYATAVDYNRDAPTTKALFAKVQNKSHYAIHGHTAAELIVKRADSRKPHMGLTSW